MSFKKVTSVNIVIDASIARSAGENSSKDPRGVICRQFLISLRGVCHRIVWNGMIETEWNKHQSRFAKDWFVSMVRMGRVKIRKVPDVALPEFRELVLKHADDPGVIAAILKDAHLVEAAWASDTRVASLDDTVRNHLGRMTAICPELKTILWVNPATEGEGCIEWIEAGAKHEASRCLKPPEVA